jgi:molybdopterin/thiamine biosynthesis adenylyltransferase
VKSLSNQLAKARVHIGGVGRIGTAIALGLHAAGVGQISCNDSQNFKEEQFEVNMFSRRSDLGRPKVYVLERFLDGRPNLAFHAYRRREPIAKGTAVSRESALYLVQTTLMRGYILSA